MNVTWITRRVNDSKIRLGKFYCKAYVGDHSLLTLKVKKCGLFMGKDANSSGPASAIEYNFPYSRHPMHLQ